MGALKEKLKSKKTLILLVVILIFVVIGVIGLTRNGGLFQNKKSENQDLELLKIAYAPITTVSIKGTTENVENFINMISEKSIKTESDDMSKCFNITPDFVSKNSEYQIFKFSDTAESFLLYQNEIYKIGNNKRGKGITSFALADTNEDDVLELFYSYEWNVSEILRSNVSYFDPVTKKEIGLNKNYREEIAVITGTNENNQLKVCIAHISNYENPVNMNINSKNESDLIVKVGDSVKLMTRAELEIEKNK